MTEPDIATRRYYALMVVGIVLPFLLSPFFASLFFSAEQSYSYRFILSRFMIWAELALLMWYAKKAERQNFLLWAEENDGFGFALQSIFSLYGLLLLELIVAAIPRMFGLHEKNEVSHKIIQVMQQYPVLIGFTTLTAGITEEFIFRGYILSRLSLMLKNQHLAVIISAALFAYVHLGYHSVSEIIFTFLFGLIMGYHYLRYRNIKVLIFVHFTYDLFVTLLELHYKHK
jgi:uncharacterized protein